MPELEIQPFPRTHLGRRRAARRAPCAPPRGRAAAARGRSTFAPRSRRCGRARAPPVAVALRTAEVVGYLLGARRDEDLGRERLGRAAGHAVEEAEDVRDLYAAAAEAWVEAGTDRALRARSGQPTPGSSTRGFGSASALSTHTASRRSRRRHDVDVPDGVEIRGPARRRSTPLIDLDLALPTHQASSPVFSRRPLPTGRSRGRSGRGRSPVTKRRARRIPGRTPVACCSWVPIERSGEHTACAPGARGFLGFAATLPEVARLGIGLALTDTGFAWAAEHGYGSMVTDWRETNLLASRFWPRRGFRRTFLRLYRSIPLSARLPLRTARGSRSSTRRRTTSCSHRRRRWSRSPTSLPRFGTRSASRSRASRSRRSSRAEAGRRSSSSRRRSPIPGSPPTRGARRSPRR